MRNGIQSRKIFPEVLALDAALVNAIPVTISELPQIETAPDPYYSLRRMNLPAQQDILVISCPDKAKRLCGEQVISAAPRGARIVPVGADGYAILAPKEELTAMVERAKAKQDQGKAIIG